MAEFVLNSASIPLASREDALSCTREVFGALLRYVGENVVPQLWSDSNAGECMLANDFSLLDYVDEESCLDMDFATSVLNLIDRSARVDETQFSASRLKIGDATQYEACASIRFAVESGHILLTVAEPGDLFWRREWIPCVLRYQDGTSKGVELPNLFSTQYDYLPREIPPFTLKDRKRFAPTGRTYKGASIYRETDTKNIWYRNTLHKNHFEVFDRHGNHLGEASMDGELDRTKRDPRKHFKC